MTLVRWMRGRAGVAAGSAMLALVAGLTVAREASSQANPRADAATRQPAIPRPRMPVPTGGTLGRIFLPETQALFDRLVATNRAPGVAGAFGHGDGPTLYLSAGRIATDATAPAAGPDTLWRVYSMTKPITGMAAMLLVQDRRIALDDPVSKYIPAFASMRVLTHPDTSLETVPATRPITIRMLLTHSAGLSYNILAKGPLLKETERLGVVPAQVNAEVEREARRTRPTSLLAFADRAAQLPLIAQPGTKWSYSIGLDVMGAVIERASGMSFERFVQTRILTPLRMTSTGWQVPAGEQRRFATLYVAAAGRLMPFDPAATSPYLDPPSFAYGGAGLVSTARDYDRFLHMIQNGGTLDGVEVMKPETVRLATSNLLPAGVTFTGYTPGTQKGAGFGAGGFVQIEDVPGGAARGTYSWSGAANTIAFVNTIDKTRGTAMTNIFPPGSLNLAEQVGVTLRRDAATRAAQQRRP
ncbi:serine hydrolase domain-containing protein [Sphingomonas citricola]|uniref:serine hydrolase domain-containing protein n=1 Tax=Sphingomonas citricola TaxID=2862498 RepID=UPI00215652D3|nr:serine hydrolase domain-containing protein [Sphingomonas citricola]